MLPTFWKPGGPMASSESRYANRFSFTCPASLLLSSGISAESAGSVLAPAVSSAGPWAHSADLLDPRSCEPEKSNCTFSLSDSCNNHPCRQHPDISYNIRHIGNGSKHRTGSVRRMLPPGIFFLGISLTVKVAGAN